MAELVPIESVGSIVQSFRSAKLDRESEQKYQEIIKGSIRQLRTRLGYHVDRPLPASCTPRANGPATEIRNETPYRLGESLLPELKETLPSLLTLINSQSSTSLWYNSLLDSLVKIDEIVERIDTSIIAIRIDHKAWESRRHGLVIMPFLNASQIASLICQVKELFESELSHLCIEYDMFFNNSNLSNQSNHDLPTAKENKNLERLTTVLIEKIDAIIQWLRKSMVRLVEEEWAKLVQPIDGEIKWLLNDINTNDNEQDEEDPWRDGPETISHQRKDLFRAAIPVMRLSRIYYNKLARQMNDDVRLIFSDSSMHMGMDQLKRLFKETNQTVTALTEFIYNIRENASREDFHSMVKWLFDRFGSSSSILQDHWLALLQSKDPGVNKELLKRSFEWLEFWSHQFFLANVQFIISSSDQYWMQFD
ncbi:hypothetical protein PSTG_05828 [Puccinia striiformis f. sp. tritici PST-78]|uniref:Uncharacterized protein n=1 Tax=Puccinia striiformis f. sp. tritici PST-78 TaxID=1165861 RepID=A0A0L0VNY4_9BASI|nr:hypothetical protein PSTG_05828 [Puccinia striiformis f. sp. tritici PST-78]